MRTLTFRTVGVLLGWLALAICAWAQKSLPSDVRSKLGKIEGLLDRQQYAEALPLLKEIDKLNPRLPQVYYGLGVVYSQDNDASVQLSALPFLEFAAKNESDEIPRDVHYLLGVAYHRAGQYDKAIKSLQRYKSLMDKGHVMQAQADQVIFWCRNARLLLMDTLEVRPQNLGPAINTKYVDYCPVLTADEKTVLFTRLQPVSEELAKKGDRREKESVWLSVQEGGKWKLADQVQVPTLTENVGTCDISPDGKSFFLFMSQPNGMGDLFSGELNGLVCSKLEPMDPRINSQYMEGSGVYSLDGNTFYFASNRPWGFGGYDIYKIEKGKNGKWRNPVNLGPNINSKFDEDGPFLSPDGKVLYFHSKGHNSMGGYDVFRSVNVDGTWSTPINLGYPINTPFNEAYFFISRDGKKAYYSSDRPGGEGSTDVYQTELPPGQDALPFVVLKGRVFEGDSLHPIDAKISLVDQKNHTVAARYYQPYDGSGRFAAFLLPGRTYELLVESPGYRAVAYAFKTPYQRQFHELYVQAVMKRIRQFGRVVGEEVSLRLALTDSTRLVSSIGLQANAPDAGKEVYSPNDVYEAVLDLATNPDSSQRKADLETVFNARPIEYIEFNDPAPRIITITNLFFYDEQKEVPSLSIAGQKVEAHRLSEADHVPLEKLVELEIGATKIYFDLQSAEVKPEYLGALDKVLNYLKENRKAKLEIAGYADASGKADFNLTISNKRANEVLNYFTSRGISRRRIVAKGYGQVFREGKYHVDKDAQKDRKVELRLLGQR